MLEGCVFQVGLLLLVAVGLALLYLRGRLDATSRRLDALENQLERLRRAVGGEPRADSAPASEPRAPAAEAARSVAAAPPVAPAAGLDPAEPASPPPPPLRPDGTPGIELGEPPVEASAGEPEEPLPAPVSGAVSPSIPAPAEPPPAPPAAPPKKRIEWERWVGVRGAAVLGGAVLALAAILFLKFSIERGLIPPPVRVALGILAGLGALGGAELLRRRAYTATANALSGAGIVILYASFWAAYRLYGLIPVALAFVLMVLVTLACGLLSWRHRSLVIAMLGLVGGFATPLLLSTWRANPIGLFGYILLLDVGLLALARARGWPVLAGLGLSATAFYQALWIFTRMGADGLAVTLGVLAVFAVLFVTSGVAGGAAREERLTLAGGLFLPFAFAVYLAARADLGESLLPIAALLLLLSAMACWVGRLHGIGLLAPAAAAAGVAVVLVWAARADFSTRATWEAVGVATALATLFQLFGGADAGRPCRTLADLARRAPLVAAGGLHLVLLAAAVLGETSARLWPWATGWLALSLVLALDCRWADVEDPRRRVLPLVAAAQVAGVGLWLIQRPIPRGLAWEVVAVAVAIAVFHHLLGHLLGRPAGDGRGSSDALRSPPFLAAGGLLLVLALAPLAAPSSGLWPWLAGWLALAALLIQRGGKTPAGYRQVVAATLLGFAFLLYYLARSGFVAPPGAAMLLGLALAVAVAFQVLAVVRGGSGVGREAEMGAALFPGLVLLALLFDPGRGYAAPGLFLGVSIVLAGLVALVASRTGEGRVFLGAVALLAAVQGAWTAAAAGALSASSAAAALGRGPAAAGLELAIQAVAVALFTFWPFVAGKRLAGDRWALYGSALAGPLWFLSLRELWVLRWGDGAVGALPVLLAAVAFGAAFLVWRRWPPPAPQRRRGLVWYLAVALLFVSLAIPLQLEKEWITVGWALEGLALLALWRRLDHAGLKYLALALLALASARLLLNPAVYGYYPRSGRPVFNWLMYAYLVPAAALVGSARLLAGLELERLLGWEEPIYGLAGRRSLGAGACGLAAVLVGFWWINLTVIDVFSVGRNLDLSFDRLPARDLSLSLAWALYALLLLAIGMARKSVGLRWLSLGFLILTIGKVFLYDLGELRDLYRVASLVGLAVSLLLVSLAYQRFVFGRDRAAPRGGAQPGEARAGEIRPGETE